ncbi:IS66 family transposase zinc-finger binding domain-containing protein, partial [Pseudomonas amygdali]
MTLFQRLKSRASLNSATQTDIAGSPLLSEPSAVEFEQPDDDLVEDLKASDQNDVDAALERYLKRLEDQGIPAPGDWRNPKQKPATVGDVAALYDVKPSFVDLLPWIEYLPAEQAMLLEDGKSLAAFFELTPIGTGCALKRIGEDVSEKLDYTPGVFTVERHVRGKWVCEDCETLIQAPVPAQIIDKGIPTAGLLAHVMIAKFADHLPLYRQESIFGR